MAKTKTFKKRHKRRRKVRLEDMDFALFITNYGPFRKHKSYPIIKTGRDWVSIKYDGSIYHVHTDMIHDDPISFVLEQAERDRQREEEYELDEDFIFQD